jgi:hypothetical protein
MFGYVQLKMQENPYNIPTMHKHVIQEHRVQLAASFKMTSVRGVILCTMKYHT